MVMHMRGIATSCQNRRSCAYLRDRRKSPKAIAAAIVDLTRHSVTPFGRSISSIVPYLSMFAPAISRRWCWTKTCRATARRSPMRRRWRWLHNGNGTNNWRPESLQGWRHHFVCVRLDAAARPIGRDKFSVMECLAQNQLRPMASRWSGRDIGIYFSRAADPFGRCDACLGLFWMVDERRIAALIVYPCRTAVRGRKTLCLLPQAALDRVAHVPQIAVRSAVPSSAGMTLGLLRHCAAPRQPSPSCGCAERGAAGIGCSHNGNLGQLQNRHLHHAQWTRLPVKGPNPENDPTGMSTEYLLVEAGDGEPLDGTSASGYDVALEQFKALCPNWVQ